MSLLKEAFEECTTMIKVSVPDGAGGQKNEWREGLTFNAGFDFQTSMQAKIGAKQGVTSLWNILVPRETSLSFGTVFRRVSDGQIFRITSKDDKKTPLSAGLNLRLVSAEEWELD